MQEGDKLKYVNCAFCPAQASWAGTIPYKEQGYSPIPVSERLFSFYRCPAGHETVVREKNERTTGVSTQ